MSPSATVSPLFETAFCAITGHNPMRWQERLFDHLQRGDIPDAIDLPTGLGKTSVMAIWLLARAFQHAGSILPRRLVYVVDRRVVVDQATAEAERISAVLNQENAVTAELRTRLGLRSGQTLPISTLRGGRADDREWTYDAAAPAIVVGTIDMIGSRLLFSGYRMSRWSRSLQAGLIGIDSLIALDEAHLSPAFLEAVRRALELQADMSNAELPIARFLPLSATLGKADAGRTFRLEAADRDDPIVVARTGLLNPTKRLTFAEIPDIAKGGLAEVFAGDAAKHDGHAQTVLVYCTARKDANAIAELLRKTLGSGRENDVLAITGARRGHERDQLVLTDTYRAFTYESGRRVTPADGRTRFLVCTSAGEVGADLDADAAIMDLVPLERMIQRLGRVNRRGTAPKPALVVIYSDSATLKHSENDEAKQAIAARLSATKAALENLPKLTENDHDGSPRHLAVIDANVQEAASTPPPEFVPTIEREHIEAWALTSLKDHPGRPDVEPFLRGVVEDEPQTTVAWRGDVALLAKLSDAEIERALAAARLHPAEVLEAPCSEVADVLIRRLRSLRNAWEYSTDGRFPIPYPPHLLIFKHGRLAGRRTLAPVSANQDGPGPDSDELPMLEEDPKRLVRLLANATILLQTAIGGLDENGALADCNERSRLHVRPDLLIRRIWLTDDEGKQKIDFIGVAPSLIAAEDEGTLNTSILHRSLGLRRGWTARVSGTTEDEESILEYWRPWEVEGETGYAARSQSLSEHHDWAKIEMDDLAKRLGLSASIATALTQAIAVHDLGKDRPGWQDGVGAPRDGRPYAKSDRRGRGMGNYRHEFGSLRDVLYKDAWKLGGMDTALLDLALHLIAAHHGRARPSIVAEDEEEIFEGILNQDAFDAAERYVRLQRHWGPWGLAWLEALFRSVDATVSRRLAQEDPADPKVVQ